MAYYAYEKSSNGKQVDFVQTVEVSLAGCKSGIFPEYLRQTIPSSATEPFEWHIAVEDIFQNSRVVKNKSLQGNALVIDATPKRSNDEILLEIVNVWGRSHNGWTPVLLETVELNHPPISGLNKKRFRVADYPNCVRVFTMLYLDGTVKDGTLSDTKWVWANPSSTNALLLWPDTLKYFSDKMGYCKKTLGLPKGS